MPDFKSPIPFGHQFFDGEKGEKTLKYTRLLPIKACVLFSVGFKGSGMQRLVLSFLDQHQGLNLQIISILHPSTLLKPTS